MNLIKILLLAAIYISAQSLNTVPVKNEYKTNIAVMNLKAQGNLSSASGILSDRLRSELFSTGKFNVMERGEMDAVMQEQGFQASGACDDQACLVQMGQMLGVDKMLAGSIGELGKVFLINIRIIDVRTGKLIDTYAGECKCPIEELPKAMKEAAENVAGIKSKPEKIQVSEEKKTSKETLKNDTDTKIKETQNKEFKKEEKKIASENPDKKIKSKEKKQKKWNITIAFGQGGLSTDFGDFVLNHRRDLMNSGIVRDPSTYGQFRIIEDQEMEFDSYSSFDLLYERKLFSNISLRLGFSSYWNGNIEGKFHMEHDGFFLNQQSLDSYAAIANIPIRLGFMYKTKPSLFRFKIAADFMYVISYFEYKMEGDVAGTYQLQHFNEGFEDYVELLGSGPGFSINFGAELMITDWLGFASEIKINRLVVANYEGYLEYKGYSNRPADPYIFYGDNFNNDVELIYSDYDGYALSFKDMPLYNVDQAEINMSSIGINFLLNFYF